MQKRLSAIVWFCIFVIGATGMFQMSANPYYEGFLAIGNTWSLAILVKHMLVLIFVMLMAYVSFVQEPRMERAAMLMTKDEQAGRTRISKEARSENRMILILAVLFFLILVFTSLARAA